MNKINFNIYNPSIQMIIIENAMFDKAESKEAKEFMVFLNGTLKKINTYGIYLQNTEIFLKLIFRYFYINNKFWIRIYFF